MVWCSSCARNVPGYRPFDGELSCDICGRVLEDFNFSTEATFVKNAAGQSQLSGNIVRTRQNDISASRERTLRRSREEMTNMKNGMGIGDERDDVVDMANRIYGLAVERNFTRGRKAEQVQASCLYFACREKNMPFLLIDFSNYLSINVYELGAVYLQLCELLYVAENKNFDKLVDPSIFIPKFTNSLLAGGNKTVVRTARDIIASMKRDWMQTGRKPSGICGAALYIAALSHGLKCSKLDIVKIVHICEATLTKRLVEFENTESGSLTVEEFMEKAKEYKKGSSTKQQSTNGVLCKHQDHKPFAYGLCQSCYDDFMTVSGGLEGGADPPAFQRAERERLANESAEANANGGLADTLLQELSNNKKSNLDEESSSPIIGEDKNLPSLDPSILALQSKRWPMSMLMINLLELMATLKLWMNQTAFLTLMMLRSMAIFTMRRKNITRR
ncbi:transcription factor IIIB 90 kDa subunit-like isoform X2 [Carica papaya]|uniref:transcription factor IIIB 90 kDa subunit-like isoform X2 n=1 Tax=Carica papaya TaxID=3649 RepID=UPI000B8C8AEA|nr:transcription factor IIIB 90 kDa subunit-like isoform X2 [Carica papaya]